MGYDFNEQIDRKDTTSLKWKKRKALFGSEDVLPMWVADMEFAAPEPITEALQDVLNSRVFGYAVPSELLFEAIMDWQKTRHQMILQKKDILFSPGVVPSIGLCIQAFTEKKDTVMIHDPVYTPFFNMIESNERTCVRSTLYIQNGQFKIDYKKMEEDIVEHKVKLFILSNPHNPGGTVWSKGQLQKLANICQNQKVILISDEIHADLVYQPETFTSLVTINERYKEFVVTLTAATKSFNIAGLKHSMIFAQDTALRTALKKEQAKTEQSTINTFGYAGTQAAYMYGGPWLKELLVYLRSNLEFTCQFFDEHLPQVSYLKPEGTYLFWFDCSSLEMTDKGLAELFSKVGKIGLNAGYLFGPSGSQYMRFNFAAPKSMVEDGLNRIKYAFDHA